MRRPSPPPSSTSSSGVPPASPAGSSPRRSRAASTGRAGRSRGGTREAGAGARGARRARPRVRQLPLIVADAGDAASLEALARRTRVVCSTVGPYARYGSELVAACVARGHGLLRPDGRGAVDAPDDGRAPRGGASHGRAHRARLRLRLHPLGPGRADAAGAHAHAARGALRPACASTWAGCAAAPAAARWRACCRRWTRRRWTRACAASWATPTRWTRTRSAAGRTGATRWA